MPAEQGDAEQFADADARGIDPRSVGDPGLARDLQIAALLRGAGAANSLAPRDDERARMRARMMAELAGAAGPAAVEPVVDDPDTAPMERVQPIRHTAVLSAADGPGDGDATVTPLAGRTGRRGRHTLPSRPAGRSGARRSPLPGRVLLVAAAAVAAVLAVAGGGVFASRNALPGDTLYPVKRVAESIGDALTVGDGALAQRRLDNATTRLDEVQTLVARQPQGPVDPQLVESGFQDFDRSTGAGARAMLTGKDAGGTGALTELHTWAAGQVERLSALRRDLPTSARPDADSTITLLERLVARTEALAARSSCPQVTSGLVDDLGVLPATGSCGSRTGTAGQGSAGTGSTDRRTAGAPTRQAGGSQPADGTGQSDQSGRTGQSGSGGGLLPDVTGVTGGSSDSSGSSSSGTPTSAGLPLPLPITLPPLVPGLKIG